MEKNKRINAMGFVLRPNRLTKLILSLLNGYLITVLGTLGRHDTPRDLMQSSLLNTLFTYLLCVVVNHTSKLLDEYLPWHGNYRKRIHFQIVFGMCAPLMPALGLTIIYFARKGTNIMATGYFISYLSALVILAIFLNLLAYLQWKLEHNDRSL